MATYDDIRKANESIKTVKLSRKNKKTGKVTENEYAEVNQRIKAFRMVYPTGFIKTTILSNANGVCVFRAEVGYTDADKNCILGVGHASETQGSNYINETSYIENCETSAVGRALGMAGFGIDTAVASADEIESADLQQTSGQRIDEVKIRALQKRCEDDGVSVEKLCNLYRVDSLNEITEKQHLNMHEHWKEIKEVTK